MKWICDDKLVYKPKSVEEIKNYLEIGYLRVENGTWNFIQAAYEKDNVIYVEVQKSKSEIEKFELNSPDILWNLFAEFDPIIGNDIDTAQVKRKWNDGICKKVFVIWILFALLQAVIFVSFYYFGNMKPDPIFNLFGTTGWIATAFAVRSEKFFMQFGDASRATSPMNFWFSAFFGFIFGSIFIVISYVN